MTGAPVTFAAGIVGAWHIDRIAAVRGEGLPAAARLARSESSDAPSVDGVAWRLRGVTSNLRYLNAAERAQLRPIEPPLERESATRAALIPIKKAEAWWELAQDERREIFEERSRHITTGMRYLPGIARRLYHSRDLAQPFDFLTWFEYAPSEAAAFEDLVGLMRATAEWRYVAREVDIRLSRD